MASLTTSIRRILIACVLTAGCLCLAGFGTLAQSAAPSGSPLASAPPSPCVAAASDECLATPPPFSWPPVQFLGGRGDAITSSSCGVPGVETFHLVSTNEITVDEFDVSLEPYDPAFLGAGWPGTVEGTITGPLTVVPCGVTAYAIYDPATGVFRLAACQSTMVPMSPC